MDPLECRPDMREPDVIERALEPAIGHARGTLRERGKFGLVHVHAHAHAHVHAHVYMFMCAAR